MTDIIDKVISDKIREKYEFDSKKIEKSIYDFKNIILNTYKKEYPMKLLSRYYLNKFSFILEKAVLLPNPDDYESISRNCELYDTSVQIPILIGKQVYLLKIPFIINISRLSRHFENIRLEKVTFQTKDLLNIINAEYFDTYESDNLIRLQRRDILVDEKAKNPIIIMKGNNFADNTIINGNHRIIYLDRKCNKEIEGYFIPIEECCEFAITTDFQKLYKNILNLSKKAYGINKHIDTEK